MASEAETLEPKEPWFRSCTTSILEQAVEERDRAEGRAAPPPARVAASPRGAASRASAGAQDVLEEGLDERSRAKAELLAATARMRSSLALGTRDLIKSCFLADPDMWPPVRACVDAALDQMWADVEHEIERNLHFSLLRQQKESDQRGPEGEWPLARAWWRFRAFVLHHYLPHNKYIFGKLKDPAYVFMIILTCVPVHGVRVAVFSLLLLMLCVPGKAESDEYAGRPDEYQLINYILLFKGMQFLTSGLLAMALGSAKYFACVSFHKEVLSQCVDERGPGAGDGVGQGLDYLLSVVLVWIAFGMLPYSRKHVPEVTEDVLTSKRTTPASDTAGPGGRLRKLLFYDVKCFVASFLVLLLLTACLCAGHFEQGGSLRSLRTDPQFCANVFWCCVMYSLMSLPFVAFSIPGWQAVLVHSDPTGFNGHGACVALTLPNAQTTTTEAEDDSKAPTWMRLATSVAQLIEVGRRARASSGPDAERGLVSDLRAGIWESLPAGPRWTWRRGGGDGARDLARRDVFAPRRDVFTPECSVAVASARIVGTECVGSVTYFCIECVAVDAGSLDADGGGHPWQVLRRYAQFRALSAQLGPPCLGYADARFPGRQLLGCTTGRLEERQRALELWLRRTLEDPRSQGAWADCLRAFLDPESAEYAASPADLGGVQQADLGEPAGPAAEAALEAEHPAPPDPGAMVPAAAPPHPEGEAGPRAAGRPQEDAHAQAPPASGETHLAAQAALEGAAVPDEPPRRPADGLSADAVAEDLAEGICASPAHWRCPACDEPNRPTRPHCNGCSAPRPSSPSAAAGAGAAGAGAAGGDIGEMTLGQVTAHVLRGLGGMLRSAPAAAELRGPSEPLLRKAETEEC